jgi:hypothetical protein
MKIRTSKDVRILLILPCHNTPLRTRFRVRSLLIPLHHIAASRMLLAAIFYAEVTGALLPLNLFLPKGRLRLCRPPANAPAVPGFLSSLFSAYGSSFLPPRLPKAPFDSPLPKRHRVCIVPFLALFSGARMPCRIFSSLNLRCKKTHPAV